MHLPKYDDYLKHYVNLFFTCLQKAGRLAVDENMLSLPILTGFGGERQHSKWKPRNPVTTHVKAMKKFCWEFVSKCILAQIPISFFWASRYIHLLIHSKCIAG